MQIVAKTTHQPPRKKDANRGQILQDETPRESTLNRLDL